MLKKKKKKASGSCAISDVHIVEAVCKRAEQLKEAKNKPFGTS